MMLWNQKIGPNGKPLSPSSRIHQKIQRVVTAIIACSPFLWVFSSYSNRSIALTSSLRDPNRGKGGHPIVECSILKQFQICSHRLLEPPDNTVAGSMAAMTAFWNRGIRCFDIDSVTTKDSQLIAAHPEILGPKISPNSKSFDPASFTLEDMRSLGADEEGFPVLITVLEHYASLINSDETTKIPYFSENSQYVRGSLFHLDLKGPNLTPKHLDHIQDKLLELGIQNNVAICAGVLKDGDVGPGFDMLKHLGRNASRGSMCLVLRDREERDRNVAMVHDVVNNNEAIRSYASSYKFEKEFFSQLRGMPIITWTIDNEETLTYSIESGAAGVVTNHPMKLQKMLQDWIKGNQCVGG
ncbi:unnamed protein product [Cylindrotheca closterium]|uniref:Glycerophosphodiester phosphodiesterase n=1 Tax=Cylindrotheca closterium TaxID=2856 RepID=A0AAD2FVP2_9STRA|nr:unnamed protein product [Cylindrotheca closterium]